MPRYYVAPPDDPNGNAGKVIGTDDQGNFWIATPAEQAQFGGAQQPPPQAPMAGAGGGLGGLVDAVVQQNTQEWELKKQQAEQAAALAKTADERAQAYYELAVANQNLNRWKAIADNELARQQLYAGLAQNLLGNAVSLAQRPRDYFAFNQYTSGGKNIFEQLYGNAPRPDFSAPTGPIEPGNIGDLMNRMGIPAFPTGAGGASPPTPMTPTPIATPAVGPGMGAGSSLPPAEQMLRELDTAAGGRWDGNRTDPTAVAQAWWNADPARRGQPMPTQPNAAAAPAAPTEMAGRQYTMRAAEAAPQTPTQQPATDWSAWYQGLLQQYGVPHLSANDPRLIGAFAQATGLDPRSPGTLAQVQQILNANAAYYREHGTNRPNAEINQAVQAGRAALVPRPNQINPAIWDSLGPVGQQLALGAAASVGYDPDEYQYQLNATRPRGQATPTQGTNYGARFAAGVM